MTPRKGAPVVVKIETRQEGAREKANYNRFVRAGVPASRRPELLGYALTPDHAGLCYSFVGGRTLTDCLQRGETGALDIVLRQIIAPLRRTWYSAGSRRRERDIAQRYLKRYFAGADWLSETEAALLACAARYFKTRIDGLSFPSPRAVLLASRKRPYRSCILHGDMNSDNVFVVGAPERAGLVDFQKTGRGHVYEDLIALEASVRINYPLDASFAEVLEKERLIALGRRAPADDPYAKAIQKIRATAFRMFGRIEDRANYHFAVAAIGLRLMRATDLTHVARARITASALWAAKALADA